jgi:hypothetical protein
MIKYTVKITSFFLILFGLALNSCKTYHRNAVEAMYESTDRDQVLIVFPYLDNPESIKKLAVTYIEIYYNYDKTNLKPFDTIVATLVTETIWKVKMIRNEEIRSALQPAHYFAFIRKKDGALLYCRKEFGEWIGTTEYHERLYFDDKKF